MKRPTMPALRKQIELRLERLRDHRESFMPNRNPQVIEIRLRIEGEITALEDVLMIVNGQRGSFIS